MRIKLVLSLFLCASMLCGIGCNRDYVEYSDNDIGFEIKYPVGWQVKHVDQEGVAINFESPIEDAGDGFPENISVTAGEFDRVITSSEFADLSISATKAYMKNVLILKKSGFTTGNLKGTTLEYSATGFSGEKLIFHQVFFVIDKRLFSVISTLEEKNAEKYLPVIRRVVDSFQIK